MTTVDTIKSQITSHEQQLDVLKRELFDIQSIEFERIKAEWRPQENDAETLEKIGDLQQSAGDFGLVLDCGMFKEHILCNFVDEERTQ